MLIAHGPLSYLIAYSTRRYWQAASRTRRHRTVLYAVAAVAGMFPDIDLLYYYFIDATQSHRQLLTHSLLPYVILLLVGLICYYFGRKPFWSIVIVYAGIGGLSHLLTDSIIGFTILLSPFFDLPVGLPSWNWWQQSLFMRQPLIILLGLELLIIVGAGATLVKAKAAYYSCAGILGVIGLVGLVFLSRHVYPANGVMYYADPDQDGIVTALDSDSDGDGKPNSRDTDIDNDGEDNSLDFYRETFVAERALYDYTNGAGPEIPLRLGLVTTPRLIERMYANVGLFFSTEMKQAYQIHSAGYIGQPDDNEFSGRVENWQTWLRQTRQLLPTDVQLNEFDILFFTSGHVGLLTRQNGIDHVFEADPSHPYVKAVPLAEVIEREGALQAVGRILPKPLNKQY